MKIATVKEMREIDKAALDEYGIPEILLMENAGRETCQAALDLFDGLADKKICVLAGSGNNGGDAFAAARHMTNYGAKVKVFLIGNAAHMTSAAALQRDIAVHMDIEVLPLELDRDWDKLMVVLRFADGIVDGILGTGFQGRLRENTARLIHVVNESGLPVLAIDIPSGVAADTGWVETEAVRAAATMTLGLPKPGHFFAPGAVCTGKLIVDGIGIPSQLLTAGHIQQDFLDEAMAVSLVPARPLEAHKGSCGRLLVVAGSRGMTGAAALASQAVLRSGAGIATLAVAESLHDIMEMKLTEVMTCPLPETAPGVLGLTALPVLLELAGKYDAVLLGPGLGRAAETMEMVRQFTLQTDKPLILDADALQAFCGRAEELKKCRHIPVLTPHMGEMAALLQITVPELRESLLDMSREAAREYQAVFVVKSECTIVAYPEGELFLTSRGNAGMATAGSGDVLAGTIAGLFGQTESSLAPLAGVYLHGLAGDLAAEKCAEGLIASDILVQLPAARKQLAEMQTIKTNKHECAFCEDKK